VVRWDARTRQFRNVEVWPELASGHPASEVRYRFQWTFPLHLSPHDRNTVYVTSQHVHRTTNGGQSWEVISPDLTTNDVSRQGISGGLTPDNIGVEYCCVIYAFDESPVQPGVLWTGSNDGLVHVSRDGGSSWTNVTSNFPDLPPDGVVRNIDASRYDAGKAYIAIEHHQQGNFEPHVYKTEDYGDSWTKIVDGIADSPLSYARSIQEDPVRPGLLYLGTENALYVSFDDGERWQPLQNNLPASPMYWLAVQERFNDLVVGTYGRGFWILDDITPLRQLTEEVVASSAHLFEPRDAYRFRPLTRARALPNDPSAGQNPPYGASINYWLADALEDSVTLRITDRSGRLVRTLSGPHSPGVNRIWWNLRDEPSTEIKLRTKPLYADWVDLGEDGWRSGGQNLSMLVPPGTYTVTLEVDGQSPSQQELRVLKDPNSEGTEANIRAQTAMFSELRDDYEVVVGMVNRLEWIRRQLYDLNRVLEDQGDAPGIIEASAELNDKLHAVEGNLIRLMTTGTGQDGVRWAPKLAEDIRYLAGAVATADFPPTDQARQVQVILNQKVTRYRAEVDELLRTDVAGFNRMLRDRNMPRVISDLD